MAIEAEADALLADSDKLSAKAFFDLTSFAHSGLFDNCQYVWEGLAKLQDYLRGRAAGNLRALGRFRRPLARTMVLWQGEIWSRGCEILGGEVSTGNFRVRIEGKEVTDASVLYAGSVLWDEHIVIAPGCVVEPGALIQGPTIIGANTEIRHGAYVRGGCLLGSRCVVGHTTEIKGSIMLNDAKAGHFAYLGDSILGHAVNLGAGTKLANLKLKGGTVCVPTGSGRVDTGLGKFGAVLGDGVQIGCNAVTNPGTLLGKGCLVLPLTCVSAGYHELQSLAC